jgi:hypothetical protein
MPTTSPESIVNRLRAPASQGLSFVISEDYPFNRGPKALLKRFEMPDLSKLPALLGWRIGLPVEMNNDFFAFYEDLNDPCNGLDHGFPVDSCRNRIRPKAMLQRLGPSEGYCGAPVHLLQKSLQGDKVYSVAFTPAVLLELPDPNGDGIVSIVLGAAACNDLSKWLANAAHQLKKWETEEGERELVDHAKSLTDLMVGPNAAELAMDELMGTGESDD